MGFEAKKKGWLAVLALCAILFFVGSLVLSAWVPNLFISPDETANAWFIHLFAETGQMRFVDALNAELDGHVHPRSMIVFNGWTVPVGFLGLATLYGAFTRLVGAWVLPVLTPLIAVAAVFAFRRLVARWFEERIANVTTIVLFVHPALWYYTARGLMPNVLFVSLVLLAAYLWVERPWYPSWSALLSGGLLGLAVFVRASEAAWIAAIMLGLVVVYWHALQKKDLLLCMVGGLIGIAPFFLMNYFTYGDPLLTGYTLPPAVETVSTTQSSTDRGGITLFPFGLDPRSIVVNMIDYGLMLFWWLSIPAAIGFFSLLFQKKPLTKQAQVFLWIFVGLMLWLGCWYGSWLIHDNPDPSAVTIANSYVRYWLPVFVLSTPLVAIGLIWVHDRLRKKLLPVFLVAIVLLGIRTTFFDGRDGLKGVGETLARSLQIREEVRSRIEPDSLIIVDRADKLFFPHRVMYPLRSENTYTLMPRAVESVPLYYYGITFPASDMTYLNERKLKELGLHIEELQTFDEESLYRITKP